jgi:hypothetical protein
LYENIQDDAVLIDRSPEIAPLDIDLHTYLIEAPWGARSGPTPARLVGKGLAELLTLLPDRFLGDEHPADQPPLFEDVTAETETEVEPHAVTHDLNRKTMTTRQRVGCRHETGVHHPCLSPSINGYLDNTLSA